MTVADHILTLFRDRPDAWKTLADLDKAIRASWPGGAIGLHDIEDAARALTAAGVLATDLGQTAWRMAFSPDWRTSCAWQHASDPGRMRHWKRVAQEDADFREALVYSRLQADRPLCVEAASYGIDLMDVWRRHDPFGREGRWTRGHLGQPLRVKTYRPYVGLVIVEGWSASAAYRGETTYPIASWVRVHIGSPGFLPEDFEPAGVPTIPRHGYTNRPGSCSGILDGPSPLGLSVKTPP